MSWWKIAAGVAAGLVVTAGVAVVVSAAAQPRPGAPPSPAPPPEPRPKKAAKPAPLPEPPRALLPEDDALAKLCIRAMIQAARTDDRIDDKENQRLMGVLVDATEEQRAFVESQLRGPRDVMGLIGDTQRGQEETVYFMALAAIDPDNRAERDFLERLAGGLGLSEDTRRGLHARLGMAPPVRPAM